MISLRNGSPKRTLSYQVTFPKKNSPQKFVNITFADYICKNFDNQKKHKKMVMDNTTDGITFPLNDAQKAILGIFNVKMTKTELKKLHQILSEFMYELSMKKIDNLQKQGKYPSTSEIAKIHHK